MVAKKIWSRDLCLVEGLYLLPERFRWKMQFISSALSRTDGFAWRNYLKECCHCHCSSSPGPIKPSFESQSLCWGFPGDVLNQQSSKNSQTQLLPCKHLSVPGCFWLSCKTERIVPWAANAQLSAVQLPGQELPVPGFCSWKTKSTVSHEQF